MDNIIVKTRSLTKRYGGITALRNVNLELPAGKIIGLMGPNGSGKTTLLKILANLLMTYEGEVLINGHKPGIESKRIISFARLQLSFRTVDRARRDRVFPRFLR